MHKTKSTQQHAEMRIFDNQGRRLYLTPEERKAFAEAALNSSFSHEARTFCRTLYYTGCRPTEALELTNDRVDSVNFTLVFRSIKKRSTIPQYRAVPIPTTFYDELNLVHNLTRRRDVYRLWPWSYVTAWTRVKEVMEAAGIQGVHASSKGLRHGFGVAHALNKTPLPQLQKWLGHEHIETTSIYMQAVGEEERALAAGIWD